MPDLNGKITKWFSEKKYGQINCGEIFFNFEEKDLSEDLKKSIKEGLEVSFFVQKHAKGQKAKSIELYCVDKIDNIIAYNLPRDSNGLINEEKGGENYTLMLNRFSRRVFLEEEIVAMTKPELYYHCVGGKNNDYMKPLSLDFTKEIIKQLKKKNKEIMLYSKSKVEIKFKVFDKLAVGIGGQSPYGNVALITLHHIYGIPYIPASSLKGLLRHYFEMEVLKSRENKMHKNTFLDLFGADENEDGGARQGKLFFLDAFPTETPKLTFDVLTPHNSDYFGKKGDRNPLGGETVDNDPPTDYSNPVPTFFPAIMPVNFAIYIGAFSDIDEDTMNAVGTVLKEALENYGIGAKTSVGYGLGHAELIKSNN